MSVSECDILDLALWAAKGPVQTGSLGVMGLAVFGTAFVYHYDDHTASMQYELSGWVNYVKCGKYFNDF